MFRIQQSLLFCISVQLFLASAAHLQPEVSTLADVQVECREVFTEASGEFTSPNYPEDYPDNATCTWEIIVGERQQVRLEFIDFHLEASFECSNDYLEIFDGESYSIHCGRDIPDVIVSVGNSMSIVLVTDEVIHVGDRFIAQYEAVEAAVECEHTVDLDDIANYGFYLSPYHPEQYPNGVSCRYEFVKDDPGSEQYNDRTRVAFLRLKTDGNSTNPATGDLVTVLEDGTVSATYAGNSQTIAADETTRSNLPFVSLFGRNVTVKFESDGDESDEGYLFAFASQIDYTFRNPFASEFEFGSQKVPQNPETLEGRPAADVVRMDFRTHEVTSTNPRLANVAHFGSPGRQDTVDYGFFMSPNHPNLYGNYEDVEYEIIVPDGKRITIFTLRFHLEIHYDYLRLRANSSSPEESWSGSTGLTYVWVSQTSTTTARFTSDSSNRATGFLAAVAAVDIYDDVDMY